MVLSPGGTAHNCQPKINNLSTKNATFKLLKCSYLSHHFIFLQFEVTLTESNILYNSILDPKSWPRAVNTSEYTVREQPIVESQVKYVVDSGATHDTRVASRP